MLQDYKKILVPVGYGEEAEQVVKSANLFAKTYQSHITLLHVIEENLIFPSYDFLAPYAPDFDLKHMAEKIEVFMDKLAQEIGLNAYDKKVCYGFPDAKILETAKEQGADLILLGSHHRNKLDFLLSSTANAILHKANCDVYIVKKQDLVAKPKKILVCIDFVPDIEPVILRAKEIANQYQAELTLIHVCNRWPIYEAPVSAFEKEVVDKINWQLKQLVETYKLKKPAAELVLGLPKYEITRYAKENNIDLIVVGSHAKHGVQLLLGSVANGVLNRAACDVLAIRVGA